VPKPASPLSGNIIWWGDRSLGRFEAADLRVAAAVEWDMTYFVRRETLLPDSQERSGESCAQGVHPRKMCLKHLFIGSDSEQRFHLAKLRIFSCPRELENNYVRHPKEFIFNHFLIEKLQFLPPYKKIPFF
jgi:hypothetical protein